MHTKGPPCGLYMHSDVTGSGGDPIQARLPRARFRNSRRDVHLLSSCWPIHFVQVLDMTGTIAPRMLRPAARLLGRAQAAQRSSFGRPLMTAGPSVVLKPRISIAGPSQGLRYISSSSTARAGGSQTGAPAAGSNGEQPTQYVAIRNGHPASWNADPPAGPCLRASTSASPKKTWTRCTRTWRSYVSSLAQKNGKSSTR